MAKKKIPTVAELRDYLEKEDAYLNDCIANHKTYIITGPKFPGETIWRSKSTLPLLEAAEVVGTPKEEIWKLCSKISSTTHAPVTKKEYERMLPFTTKTSIVDAVLKYLETYIPDYDYIGWSLKFDITGYYYCIALISQSDYRHDECETQLWNSVNYHIENDPDKGMVLLRNMKVLEGNYPYLKPMKEKLLEAQKGQ